MPNIVHWPLTMCVPFCISLLLWPDKYEPSKHRYSASTMSEPQNGLQESHHRERAPRHAKIRYQLSPRICPTDLRNSAMQQHALTRKQPHCVSNTVHWPKTMCVLFCISLLLWPDKYKLSQQRPNTVIQLPRCQNHKTCCKKATTERERHGELSKPAIRHLWMWNATPPRLLYKIIEL